jgi:hypothetical protein
VKQVAKERMRMLAQDEGLVWVDITDDLEATDIGSYWNAVRRYRRSGDDSDLWPFEGAGVGLYSFETDLDAIDFWAATGELDFEDIYEDVQREEEG